MLCLLQSGNNPNHTAIEARHEVTQSRTLTDRIDPARVGALMAVLGGGGDPPPVGATLPPLSHLVYFWEPVPQDALGADGHPKLGGLIPDLGLPRRMWAGGRFTFHAPLRAGILAQRVTRVTQTIRKEGRSGRLAFVMLRHDISQKGQLVLTEDQDLVYRAARRPGETPPSPPERQTGTGERIPVTFPATMLFRYSALTLNGHRIHYDTDFARAEGYPGLVVHGPLLATMLAMLARDRLGALNSFEFRATAPLFADEPAALVSDGTSLRVEGPDRRLCMTATAEVSDS